MAKNILITGSSGLVGTALTGFLQERGFRVIGLVRGNAPEGVPRWSPQEGTIDLWGCDSIDAVINLAGESIAEGRWNEEKKERILQSRVQGTRLLADHFASAKVRPHTFISASAVGCYGDRGDEVLDETASMGDGFLSDVCRQWEAAAVPARDAGIRVVYLRLGIVLSRDGGALKKMLLPFKLGVGGVIGTGRQFMSWVALDDVPAIVHHLLATPSLSGPVNCVAPEPVTNRAFTKTLGRALRRPTLLPLPAFAARAAAGEMANELLLASCRAVPAKLLESGYGFLHTDLAEALESLL